MRRCYPSTIRVVRDSAEQRPLPFPGSLHWRDRYDRPVLLRVQPVKKSLWTGDYALDGTWAKDKAGKFYALVERKGAMTELNTNFLTKDWDRRFKNCMDRLAEEAYHSLLFLDLRPESLMLTTQYVKDPKRVLDKMFRECTSRGIEVMIVPPSNGSRSGELVLRWLLAKTAPYAWSTLA